jgi:hypothetical protein
VEVDSKSYRIRKILNLGLRFAELDGYTFLEQNPEKNSVWGQLACGAHRILWTIEDEDYATQGRDGVFHDLKKD